jgi:hypothetical protein
VVVGATADHGVRGEEGAPGRTPEGGDVGPGLGLHLGAAGSVAPGGAHAAGSTISPGDENTGKTPLPSRSLLGSSAGQRGVRVRTGWLTHKSPLASVISPCSYPEAAQKPDSYSLSNAAS